MSHRTSPQVRTQRHTEERAEYAEDASDDGSVQRRLGCAHLSRSSFILTLLLASISATSTAACAPSRRCRTVAYSGPSSQWVASDFVRFGSPASSRVKHYPVHTYPGEPHEHVAPQKVAPPPATVCSSSSESSPAPPSGEELGSTR
jgi:hypothetical protein